MNKAEAKFNNTAKKMNSALIELLEEKEFSQITVLEVCKKANVNRSTFYSHYNNTFDLLEEVHLAFSKELNKHFVDEDNNFIEKDISISVKKTVSYLEFIKDHCFFFKTYMDNLNNFKRDDFYSSIKNSVLMPMLKKRKISDENTINYISQFYLQGIAAIIKEWVNNNCSEDTGYIAETIILCTGLTLL